jgi:hypothetical protein
MHQHTLYAYADGIDFESIADEITCRFSKFIENRKWFCGHANAVNQRRDQQGGDVDWELGMNLELPDPHKEPEGWFTDIEEIAIFVRDLAEEFGLEFVIGISDHRSGFSEDLFYIDAGPTDIDALQSIFGVPPK